MSDKQLTCGIDCTEADGKATLPARMSKSEDNLNRPAHEQQILKRNGTFLARVRQGEAPILSSDRVRLRAEWAKMFDIFCWSATL
jgi:hypothetical protein